MAPTSANTPPFRQIADKYRQLIRDGSLAAGERLPTVATIASEWDVSPGTAHKAIRQLQGEKLVLTTQQGTTVAQTRALPTPRDRMLRERITPEASGDRYVVTEVGKVVSPEYVADLLGLPAGSFVVRREQITYRDTTPIMLAVYWLDAEFIEKVPALLSRESATESNLDMIRRTTGREVSAAQEWVTGRGADEREANALGLAIGTPIVAATALRSDANGAIEYEEFVAPPNHVLMYDYEMPAKLGLKS
jgi:DNA-binding GntR family transcriptional regulator